VSGRRALAIALALLAAGSLAASDETYDPTTLVYPPFRHCLGIHRATTFHLFVYLGARTNFDEPAGVAAVKLRIKDDPGSDSDDDELTVFGLNSGRCEVIYNTSLYNVEIFGECGDGPGEFRHPLGIAADENGNVYVADTGNDRIVHLVYRDDALHFERTFGSRGTGPGQLRRPSQIAVGASGNLYVTDSANSRVVVLDGEGSHILSIRGDREADVFFNDPVGLAVVERHDPWISRHQEFIVVADQGGARLVKMSSGGDVLATATASITGRPDARFGYLAIDYSGNVYATDRGNSMIHKFDRELSYVTSFGRPGRDDRELDEPRGITIWKRFGQIFVTERAGAQYFWIGTEIQNLRLDRSTFDPADGHLTLRYFLTETSRVSLDLLDEDGNLVGTLVRERRRAIGENTERWRGTTGPDRAPVPPGLYRLRLTATPTYSSRKHFQDTAETPLRIR